MRTRGRRDIDAVAGVGVAALRVPDLAGEAAPHALRHDTLAVARRRGSDQRRAVAIDGVDDRIVHDEDLEHPAFD
jgi:hypothetical protein